MTKTIREIAVDVPATTRVFEEFRIDYCCGGGKQFNEACLSAGVAPDVVGERIQQVMDRGPSAAETEIWPTATDLIEHILGAHHTFTWKEGERLVQLADKVSTKHSESHPELVELRKIVIELFTDLAGHMTKEEKVLFPYICDLERASLHAAFLAPPPFVTVANPVRMMRLEHDHAGDLLKQIRKMTNGFSVPEGACPSFIAFYSGLEDLEKDLHRHIHLENNVLFPLALRLEEKLYMEM